MRIGYPCLTVNVPNTSIKRCRLKNADEDRLMDMIAHNLNTLENILDYNMKHHIRLFRISSDLIPFGSNPVNQLPWWDIFEYQLKFIGKKIQKYGMRVSMHPGQYTLLNSDKETVVARSLDDLTYHVMVLDSMALNTHHKLILHIGGIYNNKRQAINRFIKTYHCLNETVKRRLVIENDDKCYSVKDTLEIAQHLNIPVIYDNLHNKINPADCSGSDLDWIKQCRKTWKQCDGIQKIHYAQQALGKSPGSHADRIKVDEFMSFFHTLKDMDIDIMLEVKDKNLSALQCLEAIKRQSKRNSEQILVE